MWGCNTCAFIKKTKVKVRVHVAHEHFPPEKVPFLCTMCDAQKLSAKTAKKQMKRKYPSSKLNVTMMFTGTRQRVEFTSEHIHEMPTESKINDLDHSEQVSEQPQKRKASPEKKSSVKQK